MWSRIMLAVDVINMATKALQAVPTLVTVPLVLNILGLGISAWWMVTTVYIFSAGTITPVEPTPPGFPAGLLKTVTLDSTLQQLFL
jgi:hypothetical protein